MNTENNSGTPDTAGNSGNKGADSTPSNTEVKTFTQDEVNQIVSGRLSKEKEKYADYDTLKNKAGEYETINKQKTDLESKVHESNSALDEVLADLISSVEETKKSLIPEQLSVVEKIKFINKNKTVLLNATINAHTPPPEVNPKGDAGKYGGKYATLNEWAQADPRGYLAYRQSTSK